jgi:sodium-independent sulfate anion transporter 11
MATNNNPFSFVTKKCLHIDPSQRYVKQPKDLVQLAEKHTSHVFLEEEPTVGEWLSDLVPTRQGASNYMYELFPSATWIRRYNLNWLLGDAIAGK